MPTSWYVRSGGKVFGPFGDVKLAALAKAGKLTRDTEVATSSDGPWRRAGEVKGLVFPSSQIPSPAVAQRASSPPPALPPQPPRSTGVAAGPPLAPTYAVAPSVEFAGDQAGTESKAVVLWNPAAAIRWSLLFTPAFGAYLHARNWRALGKPDRAFQNLLWAGACGVFLLVNALRIVVPVSPAAEKALDGVFNFLGLAFLAGWALTQGWPQAKFVKEHVGANFSKKPWGLPVGIGFGALTAYILVIFLLLATKSTLPEPSALAAEVRQLIQNEWQKKPKLQGATIQNVQLVHKEGKTYTGFLDAAMGGNSERLSLEVTLDGTSILWQIKAP